MSENVQPFVEDHCVLPDIESYFEPRSAPARPTKKNRPENTPEVPPDPRDRRLVGNRNVTADDDGIANFGFTNTSGGDGVANFGFRNTSGGGSSAKTWNELAAWARERAGFYEDVVEDEFDKRNALLSKAKREVAKENQLRDAQNKAAEFAAKQANWTKRLQNLDKDADYLVDASGRMQDYLKRTEQFGNEAFGAGDFFDESQLIFGTYRDAKGNVTGYDMVMGDKLQRSLRRNQLSAKKVKEMTGSALHSVALAGEFSAGIAARLFESGPLQNDDTALYFKEKQAEIDQMYRRYENFDREVITPIAKAVDDYKSVVAKLEKGATPNDIVNGLERIANDLDKNIDTGALKGAVRLARQAGDAANKVIKGLQKAQQVLRAATKLLAAVQTMVLAICQLIPAIIQLVKYFMQMLPLMIFLMIMSLILSLIPTGWHFKWPQIPTIDLLGDWKGLMNTLAGFGDTLAGCVGALGGNPAEMLAAMAGGMNLIKNFNPLALLGIKLPNFDINLLNPVAQAWQLGGSMVPGAPNRVSSTPDVAGLLAKIFSSAATIGSIMSDFGFGKSEVDQADLAKRIPDPELPGPNGIEVGADGFKHMFNMIAAGAELMAIVQTAAQNAVAMTDAATAMSSIGPGATESQGKAALKKIIKSSQVSSMSCNGVLNEHLDDDSLSSAAKFHFMCKQMGQEDLHDEEALNPAGPTGDTAAGEQAMVNKIKAVLNVSGGQPHSVAKIAEKNKGGAKGNVLSPSIEDVVDDLPFTAMPDLYYDPTYRTFLQNFADATYTPNPGELRDLGMLLLLQSVEQKALFDTLKMTENVITDIENNPIRRQAHMGVLEKANAAGVANQSPYTYLAFGVVLTEGKPLTWIVEQFLRHHGDIRPLAEWMRDLQDIDFNTPIPLNLTDPEGVFSERDAAFESDLFTIANRDDASSTVLFMRQAADRYGHAMGYEFFVALAVQVLMTRMRNMIDADKTPEEVAEVAAVAKEMSEFLTHKAGIEELLAGLTEVEE